MENAGKPSPTEIKESEERNEKEQQQQNYTNRKHYRPEVIFWCMSVQSFLCQCIRVHKKQLFIHMNTLKIYSSLPLAQDLG